MWRRVDIHVALFAFASAALLAAGLALRGEAESNGVTAPGPDLVVRASPLAQKPEVQTLRRDASRFLSAFFRYEGGARDSSLFWRLQVSSTRKFAAQLLDAPPRLQSRLPPAQIQRIVVDEASWVPAIAVVSGAARRGDEREKFSFLFAKKAGRWVAAGPAP
jgi:hypothetical protein